jgi:hypothetical protein
VTNITDIVPFLVVLRQVSTYYGAIVAKIMEKTKNEEVISSILTMERYSEIDIGYLMICSDQK